MAIVNLLKASYTNKLGETVGSKWKSKNVIRTYTAPANPNTDNQDYSREAFKMGQALAATIAKDLKNYYPKPPKNRTIYNYALSTILKSGYTNGISSRKVNTIQVTKGNIPVPTVKSYSLKSEKNIGVTLTIPTSQYINDDSMLAGIILYYYRIVNDGTFIMYGYKALATAVSVTDPTINFTITDDYTMPLAVYFYIFSKINGIKKTSNTTIFDLYDI